MEKNKNSKPIISLIAVVARDRGIGYKNKLLFDIPEDMEHFKSITSGHVVIMGYNTYKSIGKALPGRKNIVLCDRLTRLSDAIVSRSIEEAIKISQSEDEIFFIGGASVYEQAIKIADKLYLTEVNALRTADTYFPDYKEFVKVKILGAGKHNNLEYKFLELTR